MIDGLSNAISQAGRAVGDIVAAGEHLVDTKKQIASAVGDGAKSMFRDDLFEKSTMSELGSTIWSETKDAFTGKGSFGSVATGALDTLGVPDWASSFVGAAVDIGTMRYNRATEHALDGFGGIADSVGADGVSDFLGAASDKMGMINDKADKIALSIATTAVTGGAGTAAVGGGSTAGGLNAAQALGQAGGTADNLSTALNLVEGFGGGNMGTMATGIFDLMGGNASNLAPLITGSMDPVVVDAAMGAIGDGGDVMGLVMRAFGSQGGDLFGMATGAVLQQAGASPQAMSGTAGSVVELATQLYDLHQARAGGTGTDVPLGTGILGTDAGQNVLEAINTLALESIGNETDGAELMIRQLLSHAASTTISMLDMADQNLDVARQVAQLLQQLSTLSDGSNVCEMMGTQVRI